MMSDEPTLGEIVRLIERNHAETRDDIQAIHQRLDRELALANHRVDQAVPMNVYEAHQRGIDLRFKNVEDDVASMKATTKWTIGLALTALLGILGFLAPLLFG